MTTAPRFWFWCHADSAPQDVQDGTSTVNTEYGASASRFIFEAVRDPDLCVFWGIAPKRSLRYMYLIISAQNIVVINLKFFIWSPLQCRR
ncbi:hypothetical protein M378DRAFT_172138 [Amanita muscaria Koide BX008]|uniref:Uncharacterized protein n=1 Tax=Amanita muscaria (strain Koide BX008) TaxID=946122 RepID=A0A0C2WLM2_AMAMK|nr:hypothetical protein M378DRAFT_172138 [Amanita muscaria Koide BX008]